MRLINGALAIVSLRTKVVVDANRQLKSLNLRGAQIRRSKFSYTTWIGTLLDDMT